MNLKFTPSIVRFRGCALAVLSLLHADYLSAQTSPATLPDLKLSTSGCVYSMAIQDDGKVIIQGLFDSVNDVPRTNLARLNPNGTVDLTWNPKISGSFFALAQSGTNVYLAGSFTILDDPTIYGLARVSTLDCSIDINWGPFAVGP